jgi:hypothetical protein
MQEYFQLVRQHNIPIFVLATIAVTAFVLRRIRPSRPWWLLWVGYSAFACGLLLTLRTPAATLTFHDGVPTQGSPSADEPMPNAIDSTMQLVLPTLTTVEDIKGFLGSGDRPTLVEVYSDFGFD